MSSDAYHPLAVAAVVDETADARSFVLEIPPALAETFSYRAGQFCTFRAPVTGAQIMRSYSMSSSPDVGDRFTVTVKRVRGGTMSNWMNDTLSPGQTIEVMRPAGLFVLRDASVPIVAFAGGSGITPILSIVKTALATTQREIALVYANRDAASVIFAAELERLRAASGGRLTVHHHLDAERGFLDAAACAERAGERTDADFYLCGPAPFMDVVEDGLALRRVAPSRIFVERFEVPEPPPVASEASETESLVIRLERRKHVVKYERGDTILGAARRAGLRAPFSCERGNCATCIARVAEGRVTMRVNNVLSPEEIEQGIVLTCQAVPISREVVVDYDA
jgi:3-ketosteroid 9alpha-monooxygenase subunit B